jgi:hypothetical protein
MLYPVRLMFRDQTVYLLYVGFTRNRDMLEPRVSNLHRWS